MIDWLTWEVSCAHSKPITGGQILKIDPDGKVTESWPRKAQIRGSFESSIQVKTTEVDTTGLGSKLRIDGNPVKWFQGHNVFGSDDLIGLVCSTMETLIPLLELSPTASDRQGWIQGDFTLSRVDINYSFELPSRSSVMSWLRASEFTAKTRHGRCAVKGGTNYWGKTSRRWSLKAYSKALEIERAGHRLPPALVNYPIQEWAQNKLRIELVLRGLELEKNNLKNGSGWLCIKPQTIYNRYLKRLEMTEQIRIDSEIENSLTTSQSLVYRLWLDGEDCRIRFKKPTFYRHRKAMLKYGIDIAIVQKNNRPDLSNVVPLIHYLEAVPAATPDWAYGTSALFEPRRSSLELVK